MHTPLVQLESLTFSQQDRLILDDLSLSLSERRVGVIGRNGSGKTTLARLLCGLIPADSGHVKIAGVDMFKDRKAAINTVGLIFQNPDHQIIFPTVIEELSFGLRQQGKTAGTAQDAAYQVLEDFERAHWADRPVASLSQGQRHLVCLMTVLAMSPKVIVLDEPFTGLDRPTTRALSAYLDRVDAMLIHITHDERFIVGYDRIVWIDKGRIHADGAPEDVIAAYHHAMDSTDAFTDLAN